MAKTITLKSNSYDGRYMELVCTQTPNGSAKNTSTIKWTLSTVGGNSNYYSTGPTTVVINGTTVYSAGRVSYSATSFPASKGSKSGEIIVSHANDGSKKIDVSFSTAIYTSTVSTYSDEWTLDSIPRYATISQSLKSKTETSITMNWSSDSTIDGIWYSIDNGKNWAWVTDPRAKSGSYTISGLTANKEYNIKTRVKRLDSQLTTDSSALSVTTYNYPHCTSSPDFILGDPVTLKFYNPLFRAFKFYIIGNGTQIDVEYDCADTKYTGIDSRASSVPYLYDTIPNDPSGKYKVKVVYDDSTIISDNGNTYSINESECLPTFTAFNYKDANETVTAVTGNNQILVKGLSALLVEISVADKMIPKNSAKADKYVARFDTLSETIPYSSTHDVNKVLGVVESAGTKRLSGIAYDSRGVGTEHYKDITVYEYNKPVVNAEVTRLNNFEAQTTIKVSGSYSKLNIDGTDKNAIESVEYRYRVTGGTWSGWLPLTATVTGNKFTCNDEIKSFDNTKAFDFQIKVTDSFGDLTASTASATVDVGQAIFFISTNKKECYINNKRVLHDTIMVDETDTDLNNYVTTGLYFFGADYTPLNIPAGVNGWLEVIGSENDRIKQIWYRCGTADSNDFMVYIRTYIDGTWSGWYRLATVSQDYNNEKAHIADYIVEQGTDGIWNYEKWASGKAVCWGKKNYGTVACTTAWYGWYETGGITEKLPNGLFVESPQYLDVRLLSGGAVGHTNHGSIAPTKSQITFGLIRPNSHTFTNCTVGFNIIGKWK